MEISKLKPENAKAIVIVIAALVILFFLLYWISKTFGGLSKLFGGLGSAIGISDSPEQAAQKKAIEDAKNAANVTTSPWSPVFYQNAPAGARLFTQSATDDYAKTIWDSVGLFSLDISEVVGVFRNFVAKSQVSFLADRFNKLYNKDLISWLTLQYTKFGTPDPGLVTITSIVNALPKY
jgi:hypothetical protein